MESNNSQNKSDIFVSKNFLILTTKIIIALSILLIAYLSLKHYIDSKIIDLKSGAAVAKSLTDDEVFDLSEEYNDSADVKYVIDDNNHDLTLEEVRSDKGKLIYQILLKNQIAIRNLSHEVDDLKNDLKQHQNKEQAIRIIYGYVDLRQEIFSGNNYSDELKNFKLLTINDEFLTNELKPLEDDLKNFRTTKQLALDFKQLIPKIIASQNNDPNASFIQKIKFNLLKLITVRRINHPEINDLDGIIVQIEDAINSQSYDAAITLITTISKNSDFLQEFMVNLNADANIKKIDDEILHYLKNIAS